MKPKNFPERKRRRQLGALARLLSSHNQDGKGHEIAVLEERTAVNLRGVSSKQQRQGTRVQRQGGQ